MRDFFKTVDGFVDKYNLLGMYGIVLLAYFVGVIALSIFDFILPLSVHIICLAPLVLVVFYVFIRAILIND